jgi:hypothetical protein
VLADVVDRHDVLVRRQTGGSPRLALEAAPCALVLGQVPGEHLDGHGTAEHFVLGFPDAGHTATGDMTHDAIAGGQGDTGRADRRHP